MRGLIDIIERTGANIAEGYDEWFAIGQALAAEFRESGREWYHIVSHQSSKYKPKECDRQYNRCLRACDQAGIGAFFKICKPYRVTLK